LPEAIATRGEIEGHIDPEFGSHIHWMSLACRDNGQLSDPSPQFDIEATVKPPPPPTCALRESSED
jgi:hypothetical protein